MIIRKQTATVDYLSFILASRYFGSWLYFTTKESVSQLLIIDLFRQVPKILKIFKYLHLRCLQTYKKPLRQQGFQTVEKQAISRK